MKADTRTPGACLPISCAEPSDRSLGGPAVWAEIECPGGLVGLDQSLRLLARWLVATSRKGSVGQASGSLPDPRKPLDVAAEPKVVFKAR